MIYRMVNEMNKNKGQSQNSTLVFHEQKNADTQYFIKNLVQWTLRAKNVS